MQFQIEAKAASRRLHSFEASAEVADVLHVARCMKANVFCTVANAFSSRNENSKDQAEKEALGAYCLVLRVTGKRLKEVIRDLKAA